MDNEKILVRIEELEREIAALPPGSVTPKTVRGNTYYYHRYSHNGKRIENYIDFDNVEELRSQIEKRKNLKAELRDLKKKIPRAKTVKTKAVNHEFRTNVRIGEQLRNFANGVKNYNKRECYIELDRFLYGNIQDRVLILYGLRRTGKTTLIRQAILNMADNDLVKAAFIQVKSKDTLSDINYDLKYLEKSGFKYVFIDEVTLMEDFIEGAALFSDIYATCGMKIVLSGTDSLGFIFTEKDQLYDRCVMIHTTFIPYREFENTLGITGIDEFIRYGGTMSMGGVNYNESSSFASKETAKEYIDSAIALNIQHSLKYYQDGSHFRLLYELYKNGELTNAINRVIESINRRFTKETLTKTFKSSDLSLTARNLLSDREEPFDLYDNIEREKVTEAIKTLLDILNKEEQEVEVSDAHAYQIMEYLALLDLLLEIEVHHFPNTNSKGKKIIVSQPGLRYAQAKALTESLLMDKKFNDLSSIQRKRVIDRALSTIMGRMIEDIVLLETKISRPKMEVFQLQFAVGEFDMVVHNPEELTCEIYEIKFSKEAVPEQYRFLVDNQKCADTEHRYGTITGKYVIYRGESKELNGIKYLNVEEYLKSLAK